MEYCCEEFKNIAKTLNWFSYKNDLKQTVLCMPYTEFESDGKQQRVNYCSSCGANVRDFKIFKNKLT